MTTAMRSPEGELDAGLEQSPTELRKVFLRRAHAAARERAIGVLLRQHPMEVEQLGRLLLRDLPEGKAKVALLRRRFAIGLSNCPNSRVLVDGDGKPVAPTTDSREPHSTPPT